MRFVKENWVAMLYVSAIAFCTQMLLQIKGYYSDPCWIRTDDDGWLLSLSTDCTILNIEI